MACSHVLLTNCLQRAILFNLNMLRMTSSKSDGRLCLLTYCTVCERYSKVFCDLHMFHFIHCNCIHVVKLLEHLTCNGKVECASPVGTILDITCLSSKEIYLHCLGTYCFTKPFSKLISSESI